MDNTETTQIAQLMPLSTTPPWGTVFQADCLDIAAQLPPASFDLIYADPPFFTKRDHVGRESLTFSDRWQGISSGRTEYLGWLEARIRAMKPLLKPTGVFLLHLDWHAVHYAKVLCDNIFGDDCFQNELIWHYQTGGASKGRFSRKHDTILLYSHGPTFYFDGPSIAIPRTPKAMKRAQCATGARIKATDTHKNPDDVLILPALNPMATERTGYPTQKPVELLTRLITALCPPSPDGSIADLFCGSGTTLVAAKMLQRNFIGADQNPAAVKLARQRLAEK